MIEKQEGHRGLCSSCRSTLTCTFPRTPGQPILQCDEFDGYSFSPLDVSPIPRLPTALSPSSRPAEDSNTLRGLCRDCERLRTCTYPKPEGGVWHCEEYQ